MASANASAPALTPAQGSHSNFDQPSVDGSLQGAIIATLAVSLLVSSLSVIARCIAQFYLFKRPVWADVWIWASWASHVAFSSMLFAALTHGAGYHQWNIRLSGYYEFKFFLFVSFILYDLAIVGAKVAILLQLSSLFAGTRHNRFYWASLALILINITFYTTISFALAFQCQPVSKAWNYTVAGRCLNQDALLTSSGPFNIISDFLIFLLPIWAIWQLHLPLRRRIEVVSAFAVGLFGCICSAIRVVYSRRLSQSGDGTWVLMQNQLWANAEITAGLLISGIFILPRFFRHIRGYENRRSHRYYAGNLECVYKHRDCTPKSRQIIWNTGQLIPQSQDFSHDPYINLSNFQKVNNDTTVVYEREEVRVSA